MMKGEMRKMRVKFTTRRTDRLPMARKRLLATPVTAQIPPPPGRSAKPEVRTGRHP